MTDLRPWPGFYSLNPEPETRNLKLQTSNQDGSVRVTDVRTGVGRETLSTGQPCFSLHHRSEVWGESSLLTTYWPEST